MRRIKRFSTKRNEFLFRTVAILLPLISIVLLLSQTAFAQNTYVITDGERILVHTSSATDPAEVLDEAGFTLGDDDTYITQGGDGVSEITVRRNQTVLVDHCGHLLTVETTTETVGELLKRLNIVLDANTTVSVSLDTLTYNGMELVITRTIHTTETYTQAIPFTTTYVEDDTLPEGVRVILSEGEDGEMICTAEITYCNGIQTDRNVIRQILNKQASPRIIAIGTADPLADIDFDELVNSSDEDDDTFFEDEYIPEEAPSEFDSDQDQAASTEEDTNTEVSEPVDYPIIGNGTITTPSGEVLTYSHTMVVEATAYTKTDEGCNDWTATGTLARYGAIAVDPSVIPYGTRMYIVSNDGAVIYGIATAEDCGGAINGNRVDLYYDTTAECFAFGRRDCTIYFLV